MNHGWHRFAWALAVVLLVVSVVEGIGRREATPESEEAAILGIHAMEAVKRCSTMREITNKALDNSVADKNDAEATALEARSYGDRDTVKAASRLLKAATTALADCRSSVKRVSGWVDDLEKVAARVEAYARESIDSDSDDRREKLLRRIRRSMRIIRSLEKKIADRTEILKQRWLLRHPSLLPVPRGTTTSTTSTTIVPSTTPVGRR